MLDNYTITLTTDWRTRDPYLAIFKSQLLQALPHVALFDLIHSLPLKQYEQAAFLLGASFPFFPVGSIHLILVGSTTSHHATPYLLVYKDHYFIAEESAVLSLLVTDDFENDFYYYHFPLGESAPIHSKMIQMLQWLMEGTYEQHLTPLSRVRAVMRNITPVATSFDGTSVKGAIAYIDVHANAITNIPASFIEALDNKPFEGYCGKSRYLKITRYHPDRKHTEDEVFFMKNSLGYLEITFNNGNVAFLCNLKVGDVVEITTESDRKER